MSVILMGKIWRADLPAMDKIVLLKMADGGIGCVKSAAALCGCSADHVEDVLVRYNGSDLLDESGAVIPKQSKKKNSRWDRIRKAVFERDSGICAYCETRLTEAYFTIDHIFPRCLGGTNDEENLTVACHGCNSSKGGRTLDDWMPHG